MRTFVDHDYLGNYSQIQLMEEYHTSNSERDAFDSMPKSQVPESANLGMISEMENGEVYFTTSWVRC